MPNKQDHSTADVIRWALINNLLGTDPADAGSWPIHVNVLPDDPSNVIVVNDTVGKIEAYIQTNGEVVDYPGIQVIVRSDTEQVGLTKIYSIANEIDTIFKNSTLTISGSTYTIHTITRTTNILALGYENPQTKRNLFSTNAIVCLTMDS